MKGFITPLYMSSLFAILIISNAVDNITSIQPLTEGETLVSSGGSFELGFFSPGKTNNRYVGIWYKEISIKTVVWVANRELPLSDKSGILKLTNSGILLLVNGTNDITWSSNSTSRPGHEPIAQLLDSGNLVVRNANEDMKQQNFLWQSFDYPGDTSLPGMKMGKNLLTGKDWYFSSWKSNDDPAQGDYTFGFDTHGYPQMILRNSTAEICRAGPWNGLRMSGTSIMNFKFNYVFNTEEVSYTYEPFYSSVVARIVLNQTGVVQLWIWVDRTRSWLLQTTLPSGNCDIYATCGNYGSCNISNSPVCGCLNNFVPKHPQDWDKGDWTNGCVRRTPLDCHQGVEDAFVKNSGVKLADTRNSWFNTTMNLEECWRTCLGNCSCMAYANLDISGQGSGCLLWFGNLIDIREFGEGGGQDIYVRMASPKLEPVADVGSGGKRRHTIIVSLALTAGLVLLCLSLAFYIWNKKRRQRERKGITERISEDNDNNECQKEDMQLPLFELARIVNATDNFSLDNKLGEGGFGPVYKGVLERGQEIAVKRLSRNSVQGLDEFKNEVILIAKLQHRNLVKLLGCCIQGAEMMLIYEYMPNKSLDFIFDRTRSTLLDWPKRFHIINGISRGLLYLHQDSRLRIIHRDLKTSNVLLDIDMNPKISDFGMARSFVGNQTEANTRRVVGTYGYMSPEYAVDGIFSIKSDVFSFGVLVLEIVSGRRNRGFIHSTHSLNLLGHAWILYKEGRSVELLDEALKEDSCYLSEMLRCILVALLCVQQCPEDRPSMSSVVLMLGSDTALPQPKQPGFFTERNLLDAAECSVIWEAPSSANEITVTLLEAR